MKEMKIEPVRISVRVSRAPDVAFRAFTEEMARWWPLNTHSIAADTFEGKVTADMVVFEGRPGGRIYERMSDGREADWGRVLSWDPPHRVVFSWKPNLRPEPFTEVEVRFFPDGLGTRVELEHRGWEKLGERGPVQREGHQSGWVPVLDRFAATVAGK